jgi:hypothetical protein
MEELSRHSVDVEQITVLSKTTTASLRYTKKRLELSLLARLFVERVLMTF